MRLAVLSGGASAVSVKFVEQPGDLERIASVQLLWVSQKDRDRLAANGLAVEFLDGFGPVKFVGRIKLTNDPNTQPETNRFAAIRGRIF